MPSGQDAAANGVVSFALFQQFRERRIEAARAKGGPQHVEHAPKGEPEAPTAITITTGKREPS